MSYDTSTRRHARAEISFDATLTLGDKSSSCRIQNISPGGAQVATRLPVERGNEVLLKIGVMGEAKGTVAWVNKGNVGIKFLSDIEGVGDLIMAVAIY